MTTVRVVVVLELSNDGFPEPVPTEAQVHELLCKLIHEGDEEALSKLQGFTTNIETILYTEVQSENVIHN